MSTLVQRNGIAVVKKKETYLVAIKIKSQKMTVFILLREYSLFMQNLLV